MYNLDAASCKDQSQQIGNRSGVVQPNKLIQNDNEFFQYGQENGEDLNIPDSAAQQFHLTVDRA